MKPLNVLSLCDGIACGAVALRNLGLPVGRYFGAEIKKAALKLTRIRWPDHVELGDVTKLNAERVGEGVVLHSEKGDFRVPGGIDLFLCGSPCQSFSTAMPAEMRIGLKDPKRSGIFYDCHRVFLQARPRFFLWENVASMRKEDKATLSEMIGVEPVFIDSADFSAQMRKRLYWTNIPLGPRPPVCQDTLQDILESGIAVRVRKKKDV